MKVAGWNPADVPPKRKGQRVLLADECGEYMVGEWIGNDWIDTLSGAIIFKIVYWRALPALPPELKKAYRTMMKNEMGRR
jgi:hypothetical protein